MNIGKDTEMELALLRIQVAHDEAWQAVFLSYVQPKMNKSGIEVVQEFHSLHSEGVFCYMVHSNGLEKLMQYLESSSLRGVLRRYGFEYSFDLFLPYK